MFGLCFTGFSARRSNDPVWYQWTPWVIHEYTLPDTFPNKVCSFILTLNYVSIFTFISMSIWLRQCLCVSSSAEQFIFAYTCSFVGVGLISNSSYVNPEFSSSSSLIINSVF